MLEHSQALLLSSKMHAVFGITLLLVGLTRILELLLVPLLQLQSSLPTATTNEGDDSLADISAVEHIRPLVRILPFPSSLTLTDSFY